MKRRDAISCPIKLSVSELSPKVTQVCVRTVVFAIGQIPVQQILAMSESNFFALPELFSRSKKYYQCSIVLNNATMMRKKMDACL